MSSGLDRLQEALDSGQFPASWPHDVCRNAWCGHWERNNGAYYWHRAQDCDGRPGGREALGAEADSPLGVEPPPSQQPSGGAA